MSGGAIKTESTGILALARDGAEEQRIQEKDHYIVEERKKLRDSLACFAKEFDMLPHPFVLLTDALEQAQHACEQLRRDMQRYDTNHAYPVSRRKKGSCL